MQQPTGAPWTRRLWVCCSRVGWRRSEAAALRWEDVQDAADGRGVLVYVRRSKTDQDGTAADVRYLKNGCAAVIRQIRDRLTGQRSGLRPDATAPVLGGLNGQSIARRLTAAATAAGIDGRITGHSGRVGLASELTARGASPTEMMLAGGWKTARMVAHYSGATAVQGAYSAPQRRFSHRIGRRGAGFGGFGQNRRRHAGRLRAAQGRVSRVTVGAAPVSERVYLPPGPDPAGTIAATTGGPFGWRAVPSIRGHRSRRAPVRSRVRRDLRYGPLPAGRA